LTEYFRRKNFEHLAKEAIHHLGTEPDILKELDLILKPIKCRVTAVPDPVGGPSIAFVFETWSEAFVITTDAVDCQEVPLDSESLREALWDAASDEPPTVIADPPSPLLSSALMELLLYEIVSWKVLRRSALNWSLACRTTFLLYMNDARSANHIGGDVCAVCDGYQQNTIQKLTLEDTFVFRDRFWSMVLSQGTKIV
jgi:hypothetical protein